MNTGSARFCWKNAQLTKNNVYYFWMGVVTIERLQNQKVRIDRRMGIYDPLIRTHLPRPHDWGRTS